MRTLAAVLLFTIFASTFDGASAFAESAYERVLRTNTLRCGYIVTEALKIDPNTKKIYGIIPEIIEEAGRLLNVKIEWAEELTWATYIEAVKTGRVDALCTNYWKEPVGGRYTGFSIPLYYSGVGAYVRAGDTRFKDDLSAINDPSVKIAAQDGEMSALIAAQDFPKAQKHTIPQLGDGSQLLLEVASGKADVAFVDTAIGNRFGVAHPGKIENLVPGAPVRVLENTIGIANDEIQLKFMLDSALQILVDGGYVDRVLDRHIEDSRGYYRVAKPYQTAP